MKLMIPEPERWRAELSRLEPSRLATAERRKASPSLLRTFFEPLDECLGSLPSVSAVAARPFAATEHERVAPARLQQTPAVIVRIHARRLCSQTEGIERRGQQNKYKQYCAEPEKGKCEVATRKRVGCKRWVQYWTNSNNRGSCTLQEVTTRRSSAVQPQGKPPEES